MMMRRTATGLPSASPLQYRNGLPIATRFALCASTEVQSEKLPWVEAIAAELIPAKDSPTKSVVLSDERISWESHPLPLTPSNLAKGYLHQTSHNTATTAGSNPKGGDPGWPPIKGSAGKHDTGLIAGTSRFAPRGDPKRVTVIALWRPARCNSGVR